MWANSTNVLVSRSETIVGQIVLEATAPLVRVICPKASYVSNLPCRLCSQWVFYREEVLMCPQGEMEVEWAYTFDREHDEENRVLLYRLEGSDRLVIFDSQVDHDDGAFRTYTLK